MLTHALAKAGLLDVDTLRSVLATAPHPVRQDVAAVALSITTLDQMIDVSRVEGLPFGISDSVPARRLAFIAGRLCAEAALLRLDPDLAGAQVGRGLAGEPRWPPGFLGTITHTGNFACAAAVRDTGRRGIGIDSERHVNDATVEDICSVCFTAQERARLFGAHDAPLVATVVFSLKEAFYKAIHRCVRRFVDFDELEVLSIDFDAGRAELHPRLYGCSLAVPLSGRFSIADGMVHAVVDLSFCP